MQLMLEALDLLLVGINLVLKSLYVLFLALSRLASGLPVLF
jgi:hypothetical protein